jgi:hypothetical protein
VRANDDQCALTILLEPDVEVNAIPPDVDIVPVAQALALDVRDFHLERGRQHPARTLTSEVVEVRPSSLFAPRHRLGLPTKIAGASFPPVAKQAVARLVFTRRIRRPFFIQQPPIHNF